MKSKQKIALILAMMLCVSICLVGCGEKTRSTILTEFCHGVDECDIDLVYDLFYVENLSADEVTALKGEIADYLVTLYEKHLLASYASTTFASDSAYATALGANAVLNTAVRDFTDSQKNDLLGYLYGAANVDTNSDNTFSPTEKLTYLKTLGYRFIFSYTSEVEYSSEIVHNMEDIHNANVQNYVKESVSIRVFRSDVRITTRVLESKVVYLIQIDGEWYLSQII